ncbi:uracil-DNA glycosylase [Candidatus Kaiserbacteria bacterium]|nr:MAG: uracil-DNA glycosylase [Candidatus Kaiserbacteria bacterium]
MKELHLETSWEKRLSEITNSASFQSLADFLRQEYDKGEVYPSEENIFSAFDACPFDSVKVVIIGQDPYHGEHQANGLCFAVSEGVKLPPSLRNIFKEIESDLSHTIEKEGNLERWAEQGVLLLNATLTVRAHDPGSHQKKGWEEFTDAAISALSSEREGVVFMLWGNYAKAKGESIDTKKHLVLTAAHPSPFSAYNGFFGSKHFSQTNKYLKKKGEREIEW